MAGQANTTRYKDLDLDFIAHPITGDIVQKLNKDAVKQSVRNLVYMGRFDKPFQPHIDSRIRGLLFEQASPVVTVELRKVITYVLQKNEPRINLIKVDTGINANGDSYSITIHYQIINQPTIESVSFQMERLR